MEIIDSSSAGLLAGADWLVIILYFVVVFGFAFWATQMDVSARESSENYFLGGRNVGWFIIGASLFASNIGSEHLIGHCQRKIDYFARTPI